jgi:uncharacterized protein (UPF0332 family)
MSSETEKLVGKAEASLRASKLLASAGMAEFAGSRAYYSMLYLAEALLLSKGLRFSSHSAVNAAFGQDFAKSGELSPRFHRYLIDSFGLRQAADYGTSAITAAAAQEVIGWAEEFLTVARRWLEANPGS